MSSIVDLQLRMYLTIALVFAIAFGIVYAVVLYLGGAGLTTILGLAAVFFLLQWYISPEILKWASHLRYINPDEYPILHHVVSDLATQANVPVPRIAIAPRKDPNAYVFGRTRKSATLVVHEGLLSLLNDYEMRAVLAHEIGHLKHNDVGVMTLVSFLPMLAYLIAQNFFLGGMLGGNNRNNGSVLVLVGIGAFISYFVLQLVTLALSRTRETYADEYSALTTKRPEDLASSLLKITGANYANGAPKSSTAARSFYFADSYGANRDVKEIYKHEDDIKRLLPSLDMKAFVATAQKGGGRFGMMSGMFATHPPAYKRILFLAEMKKEGLTN